MGVISTPSYYAKFYNEFVLNKIEFKEVQNDINDFFYTLFYLLYQLFKDKHVVLDLEDLDFFIKIAEATLGEDLDIDFSVLYNWKKYLLDTSLKKEFENKNIITYLYTDSNIKEFNFSSPFLILDERFL